MSPRRRRAPDSTYPRLREALTLLVLLLVLEVLFFVGAMSVGAAFGADLEDDALTFAVVTLLAFGIVLLLGWKRTGVPWSSVFPLGGFPRALLLPIALVVLGGGVVLSELDNLLRTVLPVPEGMAELLYGLGPEEAGVLASVFVGVVVAPVTEELLFRGLILRGLLQHHSARWAIVISAVLFGLCHLNPWQGVPAAIGGLLLAWLTLATGSLWPAILVHAADNAISSLDGVLPEIPGLTTGVTDEVIFQPFWLDAAGLAVLAGGLWLLWRALSAMAGPTPQADVLSPPLEPQDA